MNLCIRDEFMNKKSSTHILSCYGLTTRWLPNSQHVISKSALQSQSGISFISCWKLDQFSDSNHFWALIYLHGAVCANTWWGPCLQRAEAIRSRLSPPPSPQRAPRLRSYMDATRPKASSSTWMASNKSTSNHAWVSSKSFACKTIYMF